MRTSNKTSPHVAPAVEAARRMLADAMTTEQGSCVIHDAWWDVLRADGEILTQFVDAGAAECDTSEQRAARLREIVREIAEDAELAIAAELNLNASGGNE